jgi:hypothetical protein
MTNAETRMTKECPNDEAGMLPIRHLDFVIRASAFVITSPAAVEQQPQKYPGPKNDAKGTIRVFANQAVSGTRAGSSPLFDLVAAKLETLQRGKQLLFRRLGDIGASGFNQLLGILHKDAQILDEFLCRDFVGA